MAVAGEVLVEGDAEQAPVQAPVDPVREVEHRCRPEGAVDDEPNPSLLLGHEDPPGRLRRERHAGDPGDPLVEEPGGQRDRRRPAAGDADDPSQHQHDHDRREPAEAAPAALHHLVVLQGGARSPAVRSGEPY